MFDLVPVFPTPVQITHYADDFSKELEYVKSVELNPANSGGNSSSKDTYILRNPRLSSISKFIDSALTHYTKDILRIKQDIFITQSWVNINSTNTSHHEHTHGLSFFSGVFYFQLEETNPPICFKSDKKYNGLDYIETNEFNGQVTNFSLQSGDLIIFPSDLIHFVPINTDKKDRISLAFNTYVKGSIGNIDTLTYVNLKECS